MESIESTFVMEDGPDPGQSVLACLSRRAINTVCSDPFVVPEFRFLIAPRRRFILLQMTSRFDGETPK